MRRIMMASMLLLAACSQPGDSNDMQEASEVRAGHVGATFTPGVSFAYRYGFRVPVQRIVALQEEHARQCEALTPAKCRVTGMTYDVDRNRRIDASLSFKLAPDIARRFGKQSVDITVRRGGMLVSASIDSEEAGQSVDAADREGKAIAQERARIEGQLQKSGLGGAERRQLQARLAELSDQDQAVKSASAQALAKLSNTPMTLTYVSGAVDPGLNDGPILGAIKDGWVNVVGGLAMIVMLLISVAPWIVCGLLLLLLWRWGVRRMKPYLAPRDD